MFQLKIKYQNTSIEKYLNYLRSYFVLRFTKLIQNNINIFLILMIQNHCIYITTLFKRTAHLVVCQKTVSA